MNLESLKTQIAAYGVAAAWHTFAYKLANRMIPYMALKCLWIAPDDSKLRPYLEIPSGYTARFLGPGELAGFSQRSEYGISQEFLRKAAEKGDKCYGILDGEVLACFGWYSRKPTAMNEQLTLHFDPTCVYMYFEYIHPNYRGKRLHAVGMARALGAFSRRGCKGMVSYVESINYASSKSCYRMGYADFGIIRTVKLFGEYRIPHSSGCSRFQFRLVPTASAAS